MIKCYIPITEYSIYSRLMQAPMSFVQSIAIFTPNGYWVVFMDIPLSTEGGHEPFDFALSFFNYLMRVLGLMEVTKLPRGTKFVEEQSV